MLSGIRRIRQYEVFKIKSGRVAKVGYSHVSYEQASYLLISLTSDTLMEARKAFM